MGCGADLEANALLTSLVGDAIFNIPTVDITGPEFQLPVAVTDDLYQTINKLTNEDLTTRTVGGTGAFDALMEGFKVHLREEYDAGRITGAEYTKAYIELSQGAMANATQFLLGREQAFWAAQTAQIDAFMRRAELEVQKVRVVATLLEANTIKANYAKTKISLALEDMNFCTAKFNLDTMLPKQALLLDGQVSKITSDKLLVDAQILHTEGATAKDVAAKDLILAQIEQVNKEILLYPIKTELLEEQVEGERSKTLDTRRDGITTIVGTVGKQKDLYTQQITSYKRDAETKAAKIFSDAWTVQKTIDEGLTAPNGFTNASLDDVLAKIKANNDLLP